MTRSGHELLVLLARAARHSDGPFEAAFDELLEQAHSQSNPNLES